MHILRILLLILFIITSAVFGVNQYLSYKDRDKNAPIITANEEILHLNAKTTDDDLLKGIKAEDDRDGDVTSTLVISGKSNFIEEGVIRVDYSAFDSHNNIGTYSRKIIYEDYHSPRFKSSRPLVLRSESSYDFSFFEAEDVLCGDISYKIKIISDSYSSDSSEFPIQIEVTNDYGDVEKLNLNLDILSSSEYNLECPALSDYIIYVPIGKEVDLELYITGIRKGDRVLDFEDTNFTEEDIEINENIDYNSPGQYTAVFTLWLSYTRTTETKMIVIVTADF